MSKRNSDLITAIRDNHKDFSKNHLDEKDAKEDPFLQFSGWLEEVFKNGNYYANAMVLSTVDREGMPSSRVMLLRDISHGGFTFFTNYLSRKGKELKANPNASLLFFWPEVERQVRIQGRVELLPEQESDSYFNSRPYESRIGAWASAQSAMISSRAELDLRYQKALERFKGEQIPRPANWGGYVLKANLFEFWQGRAGRLHDRLQYTLNKKTGKWVLERLMP